jgi:hypothetical protein
MTLKFTGKFEEIKAKLDAIKGNWHELRENQKQFRAESGGIVNWYPSTGTLNFQGEPSSAATLQEAIQAALSGQAEAPIPTTKERPDLDSPEKPGASVVRQI